jgi:chromosome segregation ATPase
MDKVDSIESEMKGLKILLNDLKSENKQLKTEARETDRKLSDMNLKNNALDYSSFRSNPLIISLDIQSLSSKFSHLKILIDRLPNANLLILQETWGLKYPSQLNLPGF